MPSLHTIFSDKKIVFLDMDGTIYLGDHLIQGAREFLDVLEEESIIHYFLTNNSSRSKEDYIRKLEKLGIAAKKDDFILSTDGVINFLQQKNIRQVYIVGTKSMKEMFRQAGIETDSQNPSYIILGFDTELDYQKIKTASLLMQKEVEMIATHCDLVCPTPEGPIPDVGSMLALFETATRKKVAKVFGKPHPEMVEFILNKHNVTPQEVIIIGDRIYTDMEMARQVGCDFVLVLSGETRTEDIQKLKSQPALVVDTIGRLLEF